VALRGIAKAARTDEAWQRLAAIIASHALWLNGWSPDLFDQLVKGARAAAVELGWQDPLLAIAVYVHEVLRQGVGEEVAATELARLISTLDESDRLSVLRKILHG
jgi:hypothetical protein